MTEISFWGNYIYIFKSIHLIVYSYKSSSNILISCWH